MRHTQGCDTMSKRWMAIVGCLLLAPGCSAMHTLRGVPAAYMPPEFQAESREGKSTIDLSLLQRSQPEQYRIEAGDVLSVYAPGLLGIVNTDPNVQSGDNPPINLPQNQVDLPSIGFPVTVRDDHTIQIPQLPALDVYGLTEREVEDRLKFSVQRTGLMAKGPDPRIVVSVMRPRTHRILVIRQEPVTAQSSAMMSGMIDLGRSGKGTSRVVDLRAYENDVAHALAQPGVDGLPGLDARNVIYVIRARNRRGGGSNGAGCPSPVNRPFVEMNRGPIIRGQSPGRFPARSTNSSGPYNYFETSQFNLSGREIARGSSGPTLIDPIPGYGAPAAGAGYGHSVPPGSQSNPIANVRGGNSIPQPVASPIGSPRSAASMPAQYSPVATYGAAPVRSSLTQSPMQPGTSNIPVQYTYPQNSPLPVQNPNPMQPPAYGPVNGPAPVRSEPLPTPVYEPAPVMVSPGPAPGGFSNRMLPEPAPAVDVQQNWNHALQNFDTTIEADHIIKIPVRLGPGESLNLSEEDVTLYDGDIVFIESRDTDVYFVGGLLGGGQFSLPRDRDLHVLEAVSLAQGQGRTQSAGSQGLQSAGGVSALNRDVTPSASRLLILRQVGCGQTMTIEVDLYKALRYPHENILVQPRDMLLLQYTPVEATAAFIQRNLFEGALLGIAAGQLQRGGN